MSTALRLFTSLVAGAWLGWQLGRAARWRTVARVALLRALFTEVACHEAVTLGELRAHA